MPRKTKNLQINTKLMLCIAILLLIIGGSSWWAYNFASSMVKTELVAQKIYFPPKGTTALDPATYPDLQQYAGQQVDNGVKAKAYANGFIGRHLEKVADGKTYAEVSSASMANPKDQKLAAQKQTLFMGQTLRGLLLNAYAFWTIAMVFKAVAIAAFSAALGLVVWVWLLSRAK